MRGSVDDKDGARAKRAPSPLTDHGVETIDSRRPGLDVGGREIDHDQALRGSREQLHDDARRVARHRQAGAQRAVDRVLQLERAAVDVVRDVDDLDLSARRRRRTRVRLAVGVSTPSAPGGTRCPRRRRTSRTCPASAGGTDRRRRRSTTAGRATPPCRRCRSSARPNTCSDALSVRSVIVTSGEKKFGTAPVESATIITRPAPALWPSPNAIQLRLPLAATIGRVGERQARRRRGAAPLRRRCRRRPPVAMALSGIGVVTRRSRRSAGRTGDPR